MEKTKKAYEIVMDHIKNQILDQELMIGQTLPPERELSEQLGVSRNSVREALKILSVVGVISSKQGAGNYVSCDFQGYLVDTLSMMFMLDQLDYDQINQIRLGLEMQAYALAVKYAGNDEILQMQEYVRRLDQSTDDDEKTMLDKKIHFAIAKASRNILILNILNALSEVMDIFISDMRREILQTEKRKGMLQEAHKQMVECLLKRDVVNGQKAMADHFDMIDKIIHKEL
ncbi:FadR/GntR family transcriptional regulator [Anaerostipes sp. MSJ-23]|uniref:FadR/GntR family transcriptional regulator n=1 Tax=Anaerostipes sp. MSJ-23 TaxID=2841520 RepID=UPI001C111E79|nr:FadR/GntR family transcriptional regulator [Anaerostipes sp. MSJ-23]MBU5460789.1 FadR family transcriptional regulator [Anaerostipes sp. MSJ-23]